MDAELTVKQDAGICQVQIRGELTIFGAAELKDTLLAHQRESQRLEINLANVAELDTAGFQILYLLKREALANGKELSLVAHSAATLEVFELLNMGSYFGDPLVLTS